MSTKNISMYIFAIGLLAASCANEDKQKPADTLKNPVDSTSSAPALNDTTSTSKKNPQAGVPEKATNPLEKKTAKAGNDKGAIKTETKNAGAAVSETAGKINAPGGKVAETGKAMEKKTGNEVSAATQKTEIPTAKKEIKPADDEGLIPANVADNSKATAPKYGIIPRDANETNIANFKSAFPDKRTLIRINFDADPDAEMQSTKAQIINALKKSGYVNISNRSVTFSPKKMPTAIHYELQHDGSVVIWVQPAAGQ